MPYPITISYPQNYPFSPSFNYGSASSPSVMPIPAVYPQGNELQKSSDKNTIPKE